MKGTTHMAVGGYTGGLIMAYSIADRTLSFNFAGYEVYPLMAIIAAVMGGIAPDVDMAHSKAGRFMRKLLRNTLIASALFLMIMNFLPQTGIAILDGAIGRGAQIDRGIPFVLAIFCVVIMYAIEKSKHRGFTHTLVGLLVVATPLILMVATGTTFVGADLVVSAQVGFLLGWLSHMVIDTFNTAGIPWLWPITKKRFKVMRIVTGSQRERDFLVACTVFFIMGYALIVL